MKQLTIQEAEKLAGRRLDRRRRYATTEDGQPDGSYGGAVLFSLFSYTTNCSGCTPSYEEAGGILDCGGGCHECGYTGKRRHTEWGPHDVQPNAAGQGRREATYPAPVGSPFLTWFHEQHGERPHPCGKDDELQRDIDRGAVARDLLAACRIYDARHQSALYAWTANDEVSG